MAMNREQRRYLQKQGQIDEEGNPVRVARDNRPVPTERTGPIQYFSEVRTELGRVMWPSRSEVINYTIVVLVTLAIVTGLVAGLDWAFAEGMISLLGL